MASEFYEQLGVDRQASAARIRSAYGTALARLTKRRRALVEQGGDTVQIDLQRARLDEAWVVLSDPLRRRRYDVMLSWSESPGERTPNGLWDSVSDGLVHPAAAVAAKLLRVTSRLQEIGVIPLAPSGAAEDPATLIPHDDDLTSPRTTRLGPGRLDAPGEPSGEATAPNVARLQDSRAGEPALRVVEGGASDVLVLPTPSRPPPSGREEGSSPHVTQTAPPPRPPEVPKTGPPPVRPLAAEELSKLVDEHGYSGPLLKGVRERHGLTLQDVADHTRISIRYLEALESESRDALPSATFVRGYVREVARMLRLEPEPMVAGYMRRFEG